MEQSEVGRMRKTRVSRRNRRLVAGGLAFLLVLPYLVVLLYARATAIYLAGLEAQGEKIYHEGFEYTVLVLYSLFGMIGLIWCVAIFASDEPWPKGKLTWQAAVIFIISGLPAIAIMVFFIAAWPPFS